MLQTPKDHEKKTHTHLEKISHTHMRTHMHTKKSAHTHTHTHTLQIHTHTHLCIHGSLTGSPSCSVARYCWRMPVSRGQFPLNLWFFNPKFVKASVLVSTEKYTGIYYLCVCKHMSALSLWAMPMLGSHRDKP